MSTETSSCCSPRALFGWSPPASVADTPAKRIADRVLPSTGYGLIAFFAAVIAALLIAPFFPRHIELAVEGLAFAAAAWWCGVNFWRSRHAHCVVTTVGWSALALLTFFEAVQGRSLILGDEQPAFLVLLGVAVVFEALWVRAFGTNAVRLRPLAR